MRGAGRVRGVGEEMVEEVEGGMTEDKDDGE